MAHNLKKDMQGVEQMAFNVEGGVPWHKLGKPVNGPMTIEVAKKVLPFTYRKEKLLRPNGEVIENYESIVISDTNKIMGIGGSTASIFQPEDCARFVEALCDEKQLVETVGALGNGERIWFLVHTPDYKYEVFKGDEHRMYTLITNAYDFSAALEARYTDIRAVCENTVNAATSGSPATVKIKHTSNMHQRAAIAAEIFKGYVRANASFKEAMQYLAKHPITDKLVKEFTISMFGDPEKTEEGRAQTILANKLNKFGELLVCGRGTDIKGVAGSMYGLFNAFTEYQDWHSTVRNAKDSTGTVNRTNSILFGQANKEKSKALEVALVLARG